MAQKQLPKIPWTELFRPRTLDEVILTRRQRAQILNWWRSWIILWNAINIWNDSYRNAWLDYLKTPEGRSFARTYLNSWKEFFKKRFEEWAGGSGDKPPKSHEMLFRRVSPRSSELSTDLKPTAVYEIKKWLERTWSDFLNTKKIKETPPAIPPLPPYKPILLVGPPGTGKTSSIYALANQEGAIVVEFNASDKRSGAVIRDIVKEALMSAGFSFETTKKPPRIILLDEVDGLSARDDRGGLTALIRLLDEIRLPVAFTANVMHDKKVRRLMLFSITVFFDRPYDYQITELARRIARRVGLELTPELLNKLKYAPDFRSVVEALETYYYTGVLPSLYRDTELNIYDAIRYAFGLKADSDLEKTVQRVSRTLSSVPDFEPWDIILWVWENAYKFLDHSKGLFGFYRLLAEADYIYKTGAKAFNWRVAYRDSMLILSWAIAVYGKPAKNIWELKKIKVVKPTIVEKLGELKRLMEGETETFKLPTQKEEEEEEESGEESAPASEEIEPKKLGLRPLLELYSKHTHISRKRAKYELKMLLHIAKHRPADAGLLFAKLGVPRETIELFLKHFISKKDERNRISKELFKAYEEALSKIGPKTSKLEEAMMVPPKLEEAKEVKKPKPTTTKPKKSKRKKEGPGVTLDQFF